MKILKGIMGGALFGAALFFIPFILMRVLFFFIIIGFIFRLVRGGRSRWGRGPFGGWGGRKQFAFADYIRGMSDDEYNRFKEHFQEEHPWERHRRNQSTETK